MGLSRGTPPPAQSSTPPVRRPRGLWTAPRPQPSPWPPLRRLATACSVRAAHSLSLCFPCGRLKVTGAARHHRSDGRLCDTAPPAAHADEHAPPPWAQFLQKRHGSCTACCRFTSPPRANTRLRPAPAVAAWSVCVRCHMSATGFDGGKIRRRIHTSNHRRQLICQWRGANSRCTEPTPERPDLPGWF